MFKKRKLAAAAVIMIVLMLIASPIFAEPPSFNFIRPNTNQVGLYEKFELRISLNAAFKNPFDPDEIDLTAEFTSPSGKLWNIYGFYNANGWNSIWMVRFSPDETGTWRYVLKAADSEGTAESEAGSFTAVSSGHHGFLSLSSNNRYLRYEDGTSFYGVGLWYNDSYEEFNQGSITEEGLDNLKRRGANFISFFPTPLETMGTGLGRYDQNRCGRLDQLFEWCEERDIHISWNIWFHSYISEAIWGGGNARYRNNPYKLVCKAVDFYHDPTAWNYQEKLYRYIIARWGYSRSLFLWFVVDEINGTEGWVYGDKAVAEEWCTRVHNYFKEHDPYKRLTTGTQSGGYDQYWPNGYRIFDIAAREIYEAQGHPMPKSGKIAPDGENPLQFSYRVYAAETQKLWNNFYKPAIIGECGWDHTYYEPGMPGYLAMYHNALWVSLTNGLCMTPFWWAYSSWLNDSVVTNQMTYFQQFVSGIDFAHLEFSPADITAGDCDAYAMKSDEIIFGWVVNPRVSVANETFIISGIPDGAYEVELYRTWQGRALKKHTVKCSGGKLTDTIPELLTQRGHAYHIGNDVAFKVFPKK